MLHILLLILKIIGILLLIILSLILLVILVALFVPIRYQAEGEKYERFKAAADITWLFRLLQVHVQFSDKKLSYYVRVAWIRLLKSDTEDEEDDVKETVPSVPSTPGNDNRDEAETSDTSDEDEIWEPSEVVSEPEPQTDTKQDPGTDSKTDQPTDLKSNQPTDLKTDQPTDTKNDPQTNVKPDEVIPEKELRREDTLTETAVDATDKQLNMEKESTAEETKHFESPDEDSADSQKKKVSLGEKLKNFKKKIHDFFTNTQKKKEDISKKTEKLKKRLEIYYRFLTHNITKAALNHVKKEVFYLLKHYLPRKLKGEVYIGFEDPATTGKVIGYLSVLNTLLNQPLIVRFNFDEKVLEGHLKIKGHIRACHVAKAGIALLIDRNIWKTYKRFQKIRRMK